MKDFLAIVGLVWLVSFGLLVLVGLWARYETRHDDYEDKTQLPENDHGRKCGERGPWLRVVKRDEGS